MDTLSGVNFKKHAWIELWNRILRVLATDFVSAYFASLIVQSRTGLRLKDCGNVIDSLSHRFLWW
jgi:hypothetical protein